MSEVHFEIFRQQGKSGGWALVEALEDRESAIKRAKLTGLKRNARTLQQHTPKEDNMR